MSRTAQASRPHVLPNPRPCQPLPPPAPAEGRTPNLRLEAAPCPPLTGSLTILTSGAVGIGRERSPAGWPRWLWRTDLQGEVSSGGWGALEAAKAELAAGALAPQTPPGVRWGSHLLHRAGCTAPAAASTRGGGGGDVSRAGAEMVRSGDGPCSSPRCQLPRRCCSSRRPPPLRSRHGPSPEMSSHLSAEEKTSGR